MPSSWQASASSFHDVALEWRSLHYVVIALPGVPHREAVVVARGEADILRASVLDGFHPLMGVEAMRIEGVGGLGILHAVGHGVLQIPLALGKRAVDAPVKEDAKLGRAEVFLSARFSSVGT